MDCPGVITNRMLSRCDVLPSIFFDAITFYRRKSSDRVDAANCIKPVVRSYRRNMESRSSFVHRRNLHPSVESRIVASDSSDSCFTALFEVVLTTENVEEIVEDGDGMRVDAGFHRRKKRIGG